ncbi:DUF2157 domain-containing protein [Arsenicibacter rosenii]|uniref:DUF2157 domain-containing protein n=1 Tax=Arsenicibacter rosenii TaxID=1750698 RepID=A0A1S2VEU5_9BACT|nr:DUF2157 domain-containing protein [Arsenicibacter rosenii]OIN57244.1 hypothetical protein BLX24_21060 [Arsenicibacter rosenii]
MSPHDILQALSQQGLLAGDQQKIIRDVEDKKPFSVHWELRAVLYAGVVLLSSGLGLLIYENYDRIGHGFLLGAIATLCLGCFGFAAYYRAPWSPAQTRSRSPFGDYALLLGCLLFLSLEGYAQYEYTIFGTRYGLVTFIPAMLFLALAYLFDHRGVLSMALTALISWVGLTVRPLDFFFKTNFFDQGITLSAIGLSLLLIAAALLLERRQLKAHFTFTYLLMAGNLLLVALVAGMFNFETWRFAFIAALFGSCVAFDRYARNQRSFLFLLMSAVYGYIGLTYLVFHFGKPGNYLATFYFLTSGIGLVIYLLFNRRAVS